MQIADAHCDALWEMMHGREPVVKPENLMRAGYSLQVFAAWCGNGNQDPHEACIHQCRIYENMLNESEILHSFLSGRPKQSGQVHTLLAMEGAEGLGVNYQQGLNDFFHMGLRIITLVWNNNNMFCSSCKAEEQYGLTASGYDLLDHCEKYPMIIDLSHISRKCFYEVMDYYKGPVMASHACADAVQSHSRNLTIEQIHAIIDKNGFIGLALYPPFLGDQGAWQAIYRHLQYLLDIGAQDVIGFGSDFDGIEIAPPGLNGPLQMPDLIAYLQQQGMEEHRLQAIGAGNLIRFLSRYIRKSPLV